MKRKGLGFSAENLSFYCADADLWQQVKKTVTPFQKNKNTVKSDYAEEDFSGKSKFFLGYLPKKNTTVPCKLDLHGLNQDQAYRYLQHFIQQAFYQRLKKVTIITGKGISRQPTFMVQDAEKADLLQIQVPRWLEHFPQVKNYQTAPRQQGGKGVLYVFLKQK